jgi:hypothetical protein
MPADGSDPFWSPDPGFREAIAELPWEGTATEFLRQTHAYQGISDRLQIEVFRAERLAGWCVTELTDMPHEYNGLWSIDRRPKTAALDQLRITGQDTLPIRARTAWTVRVGATVDLPLYVSNESTGSVRGVLTVSVDDRPVRTLPVDTTAVTVQAPAGVHHGTGGGAGPPTRADRDRPVRHRRRPQHVSPPRDPAARGGRGRWRSWEPRGPRHHLDRPRPRPVRDRDLLGLWKPQPGPIRGTVLGRVDVGPGHLWVCRLPLESPPSGEEETAATILAELLNAAGSAV